MKFTTKGSITIDVDFDHEMRKLIFSVTDTGIGIKKQEQTKLFEIFGKLQSSSKQNQQGIGMGLNVCKRIVSYFGGDMWIESDYGKGSKFSFNFIINEFSIHHNNEYNVNSNEIIVNAVLRD